MTLVTFEEQTFDITEHEQSFVLPRLIALLKTRKGKEAAMTSTKIYEALNITPVRLRKLIGFIRYKNLMIGLCSSGNGYFVAINKAEFETCIISLRQRLAKQQLVVDAMTDQYNQWFNLLF